MIERIRRAPGWPLLCGTLLAAATLLPSGCAGRHQTSLVLITIDTLRADHLGCYGYSRPTSPRIDRLAREGALFERIFASLPRTTQSIASILTGRYPRGHGARGLYATLAATNLTLAEILKAEGYATGAVVSNVFLRPGRGFEQGFDHYDNPETRWDGNSAFEITAEALRWLRHREAGAPFFLWVHYLDPHWTYEPDPPYGRAFDPDYDGPFTLYDDWRARRLTKGQAIFENRLTPRQVEHVVALYDGEIARTDAAVGALLDALDRLPQPALVALTSDHGESLGEHEYYFAHGEYLYDPGLRVPLVLRLPGSIPAGLRVDALGQNIDIAPTVLAVLGIDRLQSVDGRPLLLPPGRGPAEAASLFRAAPGRARAFAESDYQLIHPENPRYFIPGPAGKWSAVFDGRRKLIHIPRPGGAFLELYDVAADPGETRNLEGDGALVEERGRLLRELLRFTDYDAGTGIDPRSLDPKQRERLRSLGYIN
jgi:arylsulfatase A-like enzyme